MNIKIGDLLFEEKDSDKIHKIFESNLLTEEDVNLNKRNIEIVAGKIGKLLSSKFPDAEKVMSDDVSIDQIKTGLKKLEKIQISGGFEVNFFNLKGVKGDPAETPDISQADLDIYAKLGFVVFEITAKGKTISGENAQGNNIHAFFVSNIPGFEISEGDDKFKELVQFHIKHFELDTSKIPEGKKIIIFKHVGLGKSFDTLPIEDKEGVIDDFRNALKTGNLSKIEKYFRLSNQSTAKSVEQESITSSSKDKKKTPTPEEKPANSEESPKGPNESFVHTSKLADLLFEKKSLNRFNTKDKKTLVENYFNVDYQSLNNFEKRDLFYLSKVILQTESFNLLNEEQSAEEIAATFPNVKTDEQKEKFLSRLAKYAGKLKNLPKEKLKNFFQPDASGLDKEVLEKAKKILSGESSDAEQADKSQKATEEIPLDGEHATAVVSVAPEEGTDDGTDEEEESGDAESSGDAEDSDEVKEDVKESLAAATGLDSEIVNAIIQEFVKQIKNKQYAKFFTSKTALKEFTQSTIEEAKEYLENMPSYEEALNKAKAIRVYKESTDEDRQEAERIARELEAANVKFKKQVNDRIELLLTHRDYDPYKDPNIEKNLKSILSERETKELIDKIEEADGVTRDQSIETFKNVQKAAIIIKNIEQSCQVIGIVQSELEYLIQVHIQANLLNSESRTALEKIAAFESMGSKEPVEGLEFVDNVARALNGLEGITYDKVLKIFDVDSKSIQDHYAAKGDDILLESPATRKPLLQIQKKIIVDADGNIVPTALKALHKDLDQNSSYKEIRKVFIKKFRDSMGKEIRKASEEELRDSLLDFFNDMVTSGAGTPGSRASSKTQAFFDSTWYQRIKTFGKWAAIIGLTTYAGVFLYNAIPIVAKNYGTMYAFKQLGGGAAAKTLFATSGMTVPTSIFSGVSSALPSLADLIGLITGAASGVWGKISTAFTSGVVTSWITAPWAAGATLATSFPIVTSLFCLAGGILAAGIGGVLAIAQGLLAKTNIAFFTNMAPTVAQWSVDAFNFSDKAFGLLNFEPTFATALLLASLALWGLRAYLKKRQANKDAVDNQIGNLLKIYILAAATGRDVDEIMTMLGLDPSQYTAAFSKSIRPTEGEIKVIFEAIDQDKQAGKFLLQKSEVSSAEDLRKLTARLVKVKDELIKDNKIKSTTARILEELIQSLERDLTQVRAGKITDEIIVEHYADKKFKKIVYSYLTGDRQDGTISDNFTFLFLDTKEDVLASIQKARNNELASLRKLGNFSPADDPITNLASQIVAKKKSEKLNIKIHIGKIIDSIPKNISDEDINTDQIINVLKQTHGHIAANDLQQFQQRGWIEKFNPLNRKEKHTKYAQKFYEQIYDNLSKGLAACVDRSVLEESKQLKTKDLLTELNNLQLRSYILSNNSNGDLLNEWTVSSALSKITGIGGIALGAVSGGATIALKSGAATIPSWAGGSTMQASLLGSVTSGAGMMGPPLVKVGALSVGLNIAAGLLTAFLAIKAGKLLVDMLKDFQYKGNINPYEDKRFVAIIKSYLPSLVKTQVALSYAKVILMHKEALEKIGVQVTGENDPRIADQMNAAQSMAQVSSMKKNLNKEGKDLYSSVKDLGYYIKNANSPGISDYITDNLLESYIESICLAKGAPLEKVFKKLQKESEGGDKGEQIASGVQETFVYKKGLGLLLEAAEDSEEVTVELNKVFNQLKTITHQFLYKSTDLNGSVNQEIIKIIQPHFSVGLGKALNQVRGKKRQEFMRQKIIAAMNQVTQIDEKRCAEILQSEKSRTGEQQKKDIGTSLELSHRDRFVHNRGLDVLLESKLLNESDTLNYVEKLKGGNYKYYYKSDIGGSTPFTELVVDPNGKQVGGLVRSATDTSLGLDPTKNLSTDPAVQTLTNNINAKYQTVALTPAQKAGVFDPQVKLKSGIAGLDLQGTGVKAPSSPWTSYLPDMPTNIKYLGWASSAYLAVSVFKGLTSSPITERSAVPLIMGIDWARLVSATYTFNIAYMLENNRERFADLGINIIGSIPSEAMKMMQGAKSAMGLGGAESGNLGVLSGPALTRLKAAKKGKKVTEADIAKAIESNIRRMIYGYHKSYRTETYEKIQQAIGDSKTAKGFKRASRRKNLKTYVGLGLLAGGAAIATGGISLIHTAFGLPAMLGGGLAYANRAGSFEGDQYLSGDESAQAESSAIKAALKDDIDALTKVIIDISKEAKGITENFEKYGLADLLFEAVTDGRVDIKRVMSKLKAAGVLVYDGSIKKGTEEYKDAESYTVDIVCSMLDSICGLQVKGAESYTNPQVTAQNIARAAIPSDTPEDIPQGQPVIPSAAAMAASQPVPQMNQPINPAQFMGVMNQMGGPMMMMMMPMMMMQMMMMNQGKAPQGFDFSKFFEQMSQGNLTTQQAVSQVADAIDDLSDDQRTVKVSSAAQTSSSGDGENTSKSKTKQFTGDDFTTIFESVVADMDKSKPSITKDDVVKIFDNLQILPGILNGPRIDNVLEIRRDRGASLFSSTSTRGGRTRNKNSRLKYFVDNFINGRFNLVEDQKSVSKPEVISDALYNVLFSGQNSIIQVSQRAIERVKGNTLTDDDLRQLQTDLGTIFDQRFLFKIINNVFKGANLKSTNIILTTNDPNLKKKVGEIIDAFTHTNLKQESYEFKKASLSNKSKNSILSEEYVMGNLSNLLFEDNIVVEGVKSKSKELNESNINLRREWLKIWDI